MPVLQPVAPRHSRAWTPVRAETAHVGAWPQDHVRTVALRGRSALSVGILASVSRVLYVGVPHDLARSVEQHRQRRLPSFTARYNVTRLVYFERTGDIQGAVAREKEMKSWKRARKLALVESMNPAWDDLAPPTLPTHR